MYINTVLLEKNRWADDKQPSILISEWIETFRRSGFTGIELWHYHVTRVEEEEVKKLAKSKLPIQIFNSYVSFTDEDEEERAQVASLIHTLSIPRVKINFGSKEEELETYVSNLKRWMTQLPSSCQILCECHPGTVLASPQVAREVLSEFSPSKVQVIVHPFHESVQLNKWFTYLKMRISHMHCSVYEKHKFHCLKERAELVQERIRQLQFFQYNGTYSLEFTKGVAEENENTSLVYEHAVQDLNFIQALQEVAR
ncbi:hypothetical protein N781_03050 [Pontibacillus halophilus JSM 076056 = DSM 19796]|uniref:Xylose isomerase-like TIM barrel domain-containing protein n=1 Tax=Pontibacillus halophilus JSM 076056 = DSM 19796 TaxID=1385510 RepID=A0A0A5GLQ6_9BACI|nr:TIM barrel protein [Pontibacillus halophilus]KGX92080.1 hypothetical protein N781_03050 [Pontibacillus halophilus JSM 076056 = DSM 19796]